MSSDSMENVPGRGSKRLQLYSGIYYEYIQHRQTDTQYGQLTASNAISVALDPQDSLGIAPSDQFDVIELPRGMS